MIFCPFDLTERQQKNIFSSLSAVWLFEAIFQDRNTKKNVEKLRVLAKILIFWLNADKLNLIDVTEPSEQIKTSAKNFQTCFRQNKIS